MNLGGSILYEDAKTSEKKLSQQEMMIELTHIIDTSWSFGELMLIGNLYFLDK